ncbi:hypothetical protein BCR34DRAFT_497973 [Clohesyomyces aquaticus]|uniref:Beta-glucuronidase C-terminal domain-containing protein n=1 Tax=Clohesyomyces aquaticus TaxID=1231657 RepID=A0A1Y1YEE9_9PLEO|nr:hypothetical protein BCR34DRAFT_497973 [Clohesyomyces aquaticus]
MLQNLKDITGSAAHIRIGGTTANHATWVEDQEAAIVQNFATPGADQPANVTLGPRYLESFKTFVQGTQYTVGLTFDSGKIGEDKTVKEATAFYQGLGDDLFAFEVGNEFDEFPVDRNETSYKIEQYVPEWLNRTAAIASRVFRPSQPKKMFQAAAFVAPGARSNDTSWNAQAAIDLGITSTSRAKTFCTHQYFGAACSPVKPTLAGSIMNRTLLARLMAYHKSAAAISVANGMQYVLGETNSIACQGLANVSDVFGAALWSIDYALYAASVNVSGIYWHMGTGYRYAAWQAIRNGTTAPGPRPLYYGNLFTATALGGAGKQVVSIVNTTTLAGYAVYRGTGGKVELESVVLVNMQIYNATAGERSSVSFSLPPDIVSKGSHTTLTVRRLTAATTESKDGLSFAGRTVALDGQVVGEEVTEKVEVGKVDVKASEAVLISLSRSGPSSTNGTIPTPTGTGSVVISTGAAPPRKVVGGILGLGFTLSVLDVM